MVTLEQITWSDEPVLEPRPDPLLESELKRQFGLVPDAVRYLTSVPWTARSLVELMRYHPVNVDSNLSHILSLVITQENSCRYCYGSTRAGMRLLGYSEPFIQRLEQDIHHWDERTEAEKAAVDFARLVARANPGPTPQDLQNLGKLGYGEATVNEIVFLSSLRSCFGSRLFTPLAVPPSHLENVAGDWWKRLLSSRRFRETSRKDHNRGGPLWNQGEPALPFENFVKALDSNPAAAGALQRTLSAAWKSPVTDNRIKGLVFGVIGFSLSCDPVVSESIRLLAREGLDEGAVRAILLHLASRDLAEIELEAIRFARETVQYRPEQIQQKAKKFREAVSEPVLVEVLGLAALANMICRLGILVRSPEE